MTDKPSRLHRLLTALMVVLAILSIPLVLVGIAGAAKERRW